MKSAIYVNNNTETAGIASGAVLPLGNVVRRFGCNCTMQGNSVALNGTGYYDVNASVSVTPSAADTITVQLYKDGVPVNGAKAAEQGSNEINIALPAIVRQTCCNANGVLTLVVTAATSTTTVTLNALNMVVCKL